MRIAIIADIHSNLEALQAVLTDISKKRVEKIFCLGDIVGYGANPNECVDLIRKNNIICTQGNHDLSAVTLQKLEKFNEFAVTALHFTKRELTEENKNFLLNLPTKYEFKDVNKIFMVHGGVNDNLFEYVLPTREPEYFMDFFRKEGFDMLICAHTHLSDIKRFGIKVFMNPGSVGQPRNSDPRAQYAIVDTSNTNFITLEKVHYDVDFASRKIIQAGLPRYLADRLFLGR